MGDINPNLEISNYTGPILGTVKLRNKMTRPMPSKKAMIDVMIHIAHQYYMQSTKVVNTP